MFKSRQLNQRNVKVVLGSAGFRSASSDPLIGATEMATMQSGMDLLSRANSGQQASTSGRLAAFPSMRLFRASTFSAPFGTSASAPLQGQRRGVTTQASDSSLGGWHMSGGPRERSGSPSPQPPSSSLAPPATVETQLGTSALSGLRSISSSSSGAFAALPEMDLPSLEGALASSSTIASSTTITVAGTVKKVHYRSLQTGYAVLRVALNPGEDVEIPNEYPSTAAASAKASSSAGKTASKSRRRQEVTVVGVLPQITVGQSLQLTGEWTSHPQYGSQLRAIDVQEARPHTHSDVVAYLSGGVIPGVGPVTAQKLVDCLGSDIYEVLDRPDAAHQLAQCQGVARSKAEQIKAGWDQGRNAREGSLFLREAGVPAALAQRVAESMGQRTREVVSRDPYAALGAFGLPLSKVDLVAAQVGAPPDLVSRAAAAMEQALSAAANGEGHTFLPWERLEIETRKILDDLARQHGNAWLRPELLNLVAQHMHEQGHLVAEPALAAAPLTALLDPTSTSTSSQNLAAEAGLLPSSLREDLEETRKILSERLPNASAQHMNSMIEEYGRELVKILDQGGAGAVAALVRCKRIGPKTAEKLKAQWDSTADTNTAKNGLKSGLCIEELETSPPSVPFEWCGATRCYLPRLHAAEVAVAKCAGSKAVLARPSSATRVARIRKWIAANQDSNGVELSAGQCAAIEAASDAPLLVVTGGPGCGKTTVVQAIVKLWSAQGKFVQICAPTGRAAQRMGVIQNIEPSTIHRMLRFQPRGTAGAGSTSGTGDDDATVDTSGEGDGGGFFDHGPKNPLPSDAVLVDEASMLSLPLAAALMQALRTKTQLVLVGDVDQLPPVGPGGVLHSLIASGLVPVIDLREIFRQAARSAIVTSALAVRQGAVPRLRVAEPTAQGLLGAGTDALLVRAPGADSVAELVYSSVAALAQEAGFSEDDLQVITPMRKGPTGAATLNIQLQALLNPPAEGKYEVPRGAHPHSAGKSGGGLPSSQQHDRVFRIGDRVLQLVNNYDKDVFNGDQGRVVFADPHQRKVIVAFPKVEGRESEDNEDFPPTARTKTKSREIEYMEGKKVKEAPETILREYQGMELSQLELAYAITVHKAQGGEAKHVVLALSPQHGRLLTRRLLYTGLTRAKELLVVVAPGGAGDPLVTAVNRVESEARLSSLKTRLEGEAVARGLAVQTPVVFSNEADVLDIVATACENPLAIGDTSITGNIASSSNGGVSNNEVAGEGVTLSALCNELDIDGDTAEFLASSPALEAATLVSADTVRSHVQALETAAAAWRGGEPSPASLSTVLRAVPRLLVASPMYFERSLAFCQRLGPAVSETPELVSKDDSLVDQLRRLLSCL